MTEKELPAESQPRWDGLRMRGILTRLLHRIETLYAELPTQAYEDTNDRDFPGGRALNMLGPVSPAAEWEMTYEEKEAHGFEHPDPKPRTDDPVWDQVDSDEHPLYQLEAWTRIVREELDQPTSLAATVSREVAYLTSEHVLAFLTAGETEPEFSGVHALRADLKHVVHAMEAVLHEGQGITHINAECMFCDDAPRLVLMHGPNPDGSRDWWQCPTCRHGYDATGVSRCWRQMLVKRGDPPKWIPLRAAAAALNRPLRTVHQWTQTYRGGIVLVESKRERLALMVRWADARAADETTKRRGRIRQLA